MKIEDIARGLYADPYEEQYAWLYQPASRGPRLGVLYLVKPDRWEFANLDIYDSRESIMTKTIDWMLNSGICDWLSLASLAQSARMSDRWRISTADKIPRLMQGDLACV